MTESTDDIKFPRAVVISGFIILVGLIVFCLTSFRSCVNRNECLDHVHDKELVGECAKF